MKSKRTSPMKGKKYSPEHLEERRKRKFEREESWRLNREGREAKQTYQSFMEQAEWMTHVKKDDFIQFLKNAIEAEESNQKLLDESFRQRMESFSKTNKIDYIREASAINTEITERLRPLWAARGVLDLFQRKEIYYKPGEGWWTREYVKVHRNFATYCRDN